MAVRNLLDELEAIHSQAKGKKRGKTWAKTITGISPNGRGAYMFKGDGFVDEGTIDAPNKSQLFLVHMREGSAKYNYAYYDVIRMKSDGTLEHTGIKDSDHEKGWNLRMRDHVQALLDEAKPPAPKVSTGNPTGFTHIDPAHIDPNPFQPRISMDEDELLKLADNIHAHGLLQKIMVRPVGDRFEAAFGHRRLEAWRLLAKRDALYETMPCTVRELSDTEMYKFAATENGERVQLSIMEIARSIVQGKELGITQQEAAAAHGRSKGNASTLVKFVDLSFPVQDMLHDGGLSFGHGRELVRMLGKFEAEIIEKMATDAMERNYKVSHLKTNVDNAIDKRKKETTFRQLHCTVCGEKQNVSEYDIEFYSVITCESCKEQVNARKFITSEQKAANEEFAALKKIEAEEQQADSPHEEAHEDESDSAESDGWIEMGNYWRCDFCKDKTLEKMKWVGDKRYCKTCIENESVTLWCRGCFQPRTFTEPVGNVEKCGTCGRKDLADDWLRSEPGDEEIEAIETERLRLEFDELAYKIYRFDNEKLNEMIEIMKAAIVAQQQ